MNPHIFAIFENLPIIPFIFCAVLALLKKIMYSIPTWQKPKTKLSKKKYTHKNPKVRKLELYTTFAIESVSVVFTSL